MKILELEVKEGTVAIFCPEEVIDFVHQLSDSFLYDKEEMAFFETVYPEWAKFVMEQVEKQIAFLKVPGYQFIKNR
ncbi:hypothetical protein OMEGA_202 [Klebsiella phage vB_KaeM_KaOmega]|nr:hypothetical protein OMEGA_202 [Klebsiella phage vB_KaeM_KaOmega]